MKVVQRFLLTLVSIRRGSESRVPCDWGRNPTNSRIIIKIWLRPFLGGMNFSTLSEKKMQPTLSLFCAAEKASTAAISVMTFFLNRSADPNSRDAETSTRSIMVSSRSSS